MSEGRYERAIAVAAQAVIGSADPDLGMHGLDQAMRVFLIRLRKHIVNSLTETLDELKGLSEEELRRIAKE